MAETTGALPDFAQLIDLASARLGGRAVAANDEFFAPKESLLKPERAVFVPGKFTDFGKWMDGWETRRRREPGHDWCVIRLGAPGIIRGFNIDTAHFKGNQPESCTIDGAELPGDPDAAAIGSPSVAWTTILDRTSLCPDAEHLMAANTAARAARFTHVRLNIHPDGGVARLRIHGEPVPDWPALVPPVDLAAAEIGGLVVACSDMHFGSRHNLIMPGRANNMGDGWETRRRRGPGHDWCIVRLARRGTIRKIEVDTNHFKGNYPESAMIERCDAPSTPRTAPPEATASWQPLLTRTKLKADTRHDYESELTAAPCTHVRLNIYPDGGVSRLRLWGTPA